MIRKEIFIGFLAGIAGNAIGVCLFSLLVVDGGVAKTLAAAHEKKLLGSFVALGALLNLFIFLGSSGKEATTKPGESLWLQL